MPSHVSVPCEAPSCSPGAAVSSDQIMTQVSPWERVMAPTGEVWQPEAGAIGQCYQNHYSWECGAGTGILRGIYLVIKLESNTQKQARLIQGTQVESHFNLTSSKPSIVFTEPDC